MYNLLLLAIFCTASGVLSSSIPLPCKLSDIEKMANHLRPFLFAGSPEHGIKSSDPVFVEEIVGDFPGFNYKLYNSSLVGYSNCIISSLKINEDMSKIQLDSNCPKLSMTGKYELTGHLLGTPAEGKGDYTYTTGKYLILLKADLKKVDVNDGKTHLNIEKFTLKMTPQEPINFDYTNLFDGRKDLAEAFIKFNNENWREIAEAVQDPIFYASIKNVISNINEKTKIIAIEDCKAN